MGSEPKDFVICRVCGKEYRMINSSHVKTHSLTLAEYRRMFPDAPLECAAVIQLRSSREYSVSTRQKLSRPHPWAAGENSNTHRPEVVKRQQETRKRSSGFQVHTFTCETCGKQIEVGLTKKRFGTGEKPRFCSVVCKGKGRSLRLLHENNSEKLAEHMEYMRSFLSRRDTSIEREMKSILTELGVGYESQDVLTFLTKQHRYHRFDFVLKDRKIIIECDGCYWHGCEEHCPGEAEKQKIKDRNLDQAVFRSGWTLLRFWEHDIHKNQESVKARILEVVGRSEMQVVNAECN